MRYQYVVKIVSTINHVYENPLLVLHELLNDFGEDGWRCISCHHSSSDNGYVVIFERMVENND